MSIASTAIITAIEELIEGSLGSIRTVAASSFGPGHTPWYGQVVSEPRYDIQIINTLPHPASPVSAISDRRIDTLVIQIDLRHQLKSRIQESERSATRATVLGAVDEVVQALHYPGNLTETSTGSPTYIISGMLMNLESTLVEERWDEPPQMIHTQITAEAWVRISQATS